MIMRVYAMWNQSKRILYILLFIYVPQVFISFIYQGIYKNSNTYLSGMSQAKLDSHTYPLVSYHLSLQLKLSKLLVLLHATFQSTKAMPHYTYCGAWQFSELFSVLCFWFLLLPQPWSSPSCCIRQPRSGSLTTTCNYLWKMEFFISLRMSSYPLPFITLHYHHILLPMLLSTTCKKKLTTMDF